MTAMIQSIKPGQLYRAEIDGTTVRVRVIEQSKELPHLWLCSDPNGKYLLVEDSAFHRIVSGQSG